MTANGNARAVETLDPDSLDLKMILGFRMKNVGKHMAARMQMRSKCIVKHFSRYEVAGGKNWKSKL